MKSGSKKAKGPIFIIVGTLVVIGLVFLTVLADTLLFALSFNANYPDGAYAAQGTPVLAVVMLLLLFYELLMLSFFVDTKPKENLPKRPQFIGSKQNGITPPHVNRWVILAVRIICVIAVFATVIICSNKYTVLSADGITADCFKPTKTYKWENARSYSISFSEDAGLDFTVKMKDGNSFSLLYSDIGNDGYADQFTDPIGYATFVKDKLDNLQIPCTGVTGLNAMKTFYEADYPADWERIKVLIGYEDLVG